jgi:hypothetical protein
VKLGKKILIGTLMTTLMAGGVASAGKVISQYKTPRGNIATVEQEKVHKNRIGITVNGKAIKKETWYHESGVTFIPMREVSELLGAKVNYNSKTMSADITLPKGTTTQDLNNLQAYSQLYKMHDDVEWLSSELYRTMDRLFLALFDFTEGGNTDSLELLLEDMDSYIDYYNEVLLPSYSQLVEKTKSSTVISAADKEQVSKELNLSNVILQNYLQGMEAAMNYMAYGDENDLETATDFLTTAYENNVNLNNTIIDAKDNVYSRTQNYPNGVSKASISSNIPSPKKFNDHLQLKMPTLGGEESQNRGKELIDMLKNDH